MADTQQPELTLERFAALVEAYGGDLERFPARERAQAKALSLRSREAQRMLAGARALDALLASARAELPSVRLESALAEIPARHAQERPTLAMLPFRSPRRALVAAAAAMLLGVLSGRAAPASEDTLEAAGVEQADIGSLAFADELLDALSLEEEGTE